MSNSRPDKRQEKGGSAKTQRYRHMMYEQQVKYMAFNTVQELFEHAAKKLSPVKLAAILHDKDRNENGDLKEPHVHLMISFENARSINSIAKLLRDKPQYIEKWDKNPANGFSYLIHATDGAKDQYQYSTDEVIANFDYADCIEYTSREIAASKAKRNSVKPEVLLDLLYQGEMTRKEVEDKLTGAQYGKYHMQIAKVEAKRLEREAEKWREEMRKKHEAIQTYWIYGLPGTGKTRHAKAYIKSQGEKYYMSGSSRDIFQNYSGEHTIILDEFRPKTMNFSDLLKILDPYSIDNDTPVTAPARYADKTLACKCFIITSPYDPYQFYEKINEGGYSIDSKIDLFDQLSRRIAIVQKMTDTEILLMEFDYGRKKYLPVVGTAKPNPYTGGQNKQNNILDIYNKFTSVTEKNENAVDIDIIEDEYKPETDGDIEENATENQNEL